MVEFINPWIAIDEDTEKLVIELRRELTDGHLLWNRNVRPIARRIDRDDVLFEIVEDPPCYAIVHLTWKGGRESNPEWPTTKLFADIQEWARDAELAEQ